VLGPAQTASLSEEVGVVWHTFGIAVRRGLIRVFNVHRDILQLVAEHSGGVAAGMGPLTTLRMGHAGGTRPLPVLGAGAGSGWCPRKSA
jgi:hypothetical protein